MKTAVSALPTRTAVAPLLVPALLACYVIWGSTYLAIRFALQGFPPFFQMASRFLVAGGLLIGWVLWRDGVAGLPTRRQWLHALVIGGLMLPSSCASLRKVWPFITPSWAAIPKPAMG